MYVQIDLDGPAGTLRVSGHELPTVELVRGPGDEPDPLIPIGTRAAGRLTLTVDGAPAVLRPARGRILRRSYRVDATVAGTRYRLVPCSYGESRLLRDGRVLGTLESTGDGTVDADWAPGTETGAGTGAETGAAPEPLDRVVGTALAAAFGTGAAPWWDTTLNIAAELIP
ncbi:hypothetical protein Q5762_22680 [Streptomyces sp. P9(2023)]|uniref:hypothetical protein n=1 Tax=Streptomyces sp. P9(2023) TaxID=3064394 RepID=UPI0028F43934|nr:hypothetical protein [Streptomyces sp. P9(2023)]MDT9691102.1 hypothetical protein [Streptomyces sp. P9(2023)]